VEICVVEQQSDAPAGLFAEWARERGHRIRLLRGPDVQEWPDPAACEAIVPLGSERSVHSSTDAWIARQIGFLRAAHERAVPVLGLCFGAQALSAALGGRVEPAARPEIGWLELEAPDGGPVAPGPWFEWHFDAFTVPPGADELARSAAGPQAFRLGRSIGLQFHPEATPAIIGDWLRTGRGDLAANALDGEAIGRQTAATADAARERAFALFDAVAAGWS
jgi:GMP synthase-like glutamine amidotransferase